MKIWAFGFRGGEKRVQESLVSRVSGARLTSAALIPVNAEPFPGSIVAIATRLVVDH